MRLINADSLKLKKVYCQERHEWVVPVAEIDWMPTAYNIERVCEELGSTTEDYKDYTDIKACGTDEQKDAMLKYTNAWYKMFPFSGVRFETDYMMDSIIIKTDMYVKGKNCTFGRMVSLLIFPRVINELLKEASSEYIKGI